MKLCTVMTYVFFVTMLVSKQGISATELCNGKIVTINMQTNGGNGSGTGGSDMILGTSDADVIYGFGGDDTICANAGNDIVFAGNGADTVSGGIGDDTLNGQGGKDKIYGDSGHDMINGGIGDDQLWGGSGDDDIRGQGGNDVIRGEGGIDQLLGSSGNDTIYTGPGGNLFSSMAVRGHGGNDRIVGGTGDDKLEGGPGLDTILGYRGNDLLLGGNGADELDGGHGDDRLSGGDSADLLNGGAGSDNLMGGSGDDDIFGGNGDDALYGDAGIDLCDGNGLVELFIGDVATPTCEFTAGVTANVVWDRFHRPDGLVVSGDYSPSGHQYRITGAGSHTIKDRRHTFEEVSHKVMIAYLDVVEKPNLVSAEFQFKNVDDVWEPSGYGTNIGENAVIGSAQFGFGAGSVQLAVWRDEWRLFVVQSPIIDPYPVIASAQFDEQLQEDTNYTFAMDWDEVSSSVTMYPPAGPSVLVSDPWINQYWGNLIGFQMRRPHPDHGMVEFSKVAAQFEHETLFSSLRF